MKQYVGTCRYFNGALEECCKAGVHLDTLREIGGLPCIPLHRIRHSHADCDKFEKRTKEDEENSRIQMNAAFDRFLLVVPLMNEIKEREKGKASCGDVECPVCKKNLKWNHSAINGHLIMRCETEGCVRFIE